MKFIGSLIFCTALAASANVHAGEARDDCAKGTAYQPSGTIVLDYTSGTTTVSNITSHTDAVPRRFRLVATLDALVRIDAAGVVTPTASNGMRVVAGVPEYFCVGKNTNLGVTGADGNSGSLNVTRMVR